MCVREQAIEGVVRRLLTSYGTRHFSVFFFVLLWTLLTEDLAPRRGKPSDCGTHNPFWPVFVKEQVSHVNVACARSRSNVSVMDAVCLAWSVLKGASHHLVGRAAVQSLFSGAMNLQPQQLYLLVPFKSSV